MKLVTISSLALLACTLLAVATGTSSASPAGTTRAGGYRLVLGSTRAGETRAYTMLPNGSRLTPVIRPSRALEPLDVSANGRTVAYRDHRYPNAIYASSAAGTGLRRVARGTKKWSIDSAVLSPDGKKLAFTSDYPKRIFIVGTDGRGLRNLATGYEPDWSPDGRALVFTGVVRKRATLVVQPLQGRRRVLARGDASSPRICAPSSMTRTFDTDWNWPRSLSNEQKSTSSLPSARHRAISSVTRSTPVAR